MTRLSSPIQSMKEHYTVVVVGYVAVPGGTQWARQQWKDFEARRAVKAREQQKRDAAAKRIEAFRKVLPALAAMKLPADLPVYTEDGIEADRVVIQRITAARLIPTIATIVRVAYSRSIRNVCHDSQSSDPMPMRDPRVLRTLLTLLGVVFGVAAVVAMVSIGEGAQQEILSAIERMGATSIHVEAKQIPDSQLGDMVKDSVGLSRADARALATTVPGVVHVAWRKRHTLSVTDLPIPAQDVHVFGVSAQIFATHNLRVGKGRPLLEPDHAGLHRSAVIGAELARKAFGDESAIHELIRLDDAYFRVVGVLADTAAPQQGRRLGGAAAKEESGGGVQWQSYGDAVLVPFDTMRNELAPATIYNEVDTISLQLPTTEQTLPGKAVVTAALTRLHGGRRDFDVIAPEEILRQKQAAQAVLNLVLIAIAAISLIVGGIGVMNIMLANIMERVSEIGLRRAVGARKRDIRNQFLLESVIICGVGGLVGIVLGFAISVGVSLIVGLPVAFAWESMILSFAISFVVGVTFGLWPAVRAANVNPIEALRGE